MAGVLRRDSRGSLSESALSRLRLMLTLLERLDR